MNKARRKQLDQLTATIEQARYALEALRDEEQEYYDNMPESFQDGDRGQAAYEAIDAMENAISSLEEAEEYTREAIEQ